MERKYVSYCGNYYCALCAYHTGKLVDAASRLLEIVKRYGSLRLVAEGDENVDFDAFRNGLEWLASKDQACKGCRLGGGWSWWSDCPVRTCCVDKGVEFCYQCTEFPCKTLTEGPLQGYLQRFIDANQHIQQIGLEQWMKKRFGQDLSKSTRSKL
jgi:hypothetical protein